MNFKFSWNLKFGRKLNFCSDFEHKVWSRFWTRFWILSLVEMLMFGWNFEVDAWSRFWRWNLIKICVWIRDITSRSNFGKMNSILGSVVPLAMFHSFILERKLCSFKQWNFYWPILLLGGYIVLLLSNLVLHRGLPSPDKNLGIARWEQYADFSQEDTFLPKGEFWVCFFVQSVFACLANIERAQRNRGQGTQAQLPLRRPSDLKLITFKHY